MKGTGSREEDDGDRSSHAQRLTRTWPTAQLSHFAGAKIARARHVCLFWRNATVQCSQQIHSGLSARPTFAGDGLSPEHDVVHEILEITRCSPFPLAWERVEGHQDDRRKWCELTRIETLNVRADSPIFYLGLSAFLPFALSMRMEIHL
jgi:hypothetical protein